GCDMPASWLEFHHRDPWSHGGATDLVNGLPLCPPHHHKADHPDTWTMTHNPDSTINFHRRT
ncbi:MAG: HNH endonuclease, partial [Nocardioides sp.]